jgi:hypothetical protein
MGQNALHEQTAEVPGIALGMAVLAFYPASAPWLIPVVCN